MSSIPHGAESYDPSVRYTISFKELARNRKYPSRLLSSPTRARRQGEIFKEAAGTPKRSIHYEKRRWALKNTSSLLFEQFLQGLLSVVQDMGGETGLVMGNLYSIFMVEPLRSLYLDTLRLLEICFAEHLLSENNYGHPAGLVGSQKRLHLLQMPLLRAWNGPLAHIKKKYALPGLHVSFANREKAGQLAFLQKMDHEICCRRTSTTWQTSTFRLSHRQRLKTLVLEATVSSLQ